MHPSLRRSIPFLTMLAVCAIIAWPIQARLGQEYESSNCKVGFSVAWRDVVAAAPEDIHSFLATLKSSGVGALMVEAYRPAVSREEAFIQAKAASMEIIAPWTSKDADSIATSGARYVTLKPDGLRPSEVDELARASLLHHWTFLWTDYDVIPGDREVALKLQETAQRFHRPTDGEIAGLSAAALRARYVRATLERSSRWVLVRPPAGVNSAGFNSFVGSVKNAIERDRPFLPRLTVLTPDEPKSIEASAAKPLAVIATIIMVLGTITSIAAAKSDRWPPKQMRAAAAIAGSAGLVSITAGLAIVLCAPIQILLYPRFHLWRTSLAYAFSVTVQLVSGFIIGSVADRASLLGFASYSGIRLSLIAPLVLVACMLLWVPATCEWRVEAPNWLTPLFLCYAALLTISMLSRSGNEHFVEPAAWEVQARDWLESALVARPRTKEFLFGAPCLLIGVWQ